MPNVDVGWVILYDIFMDALNKVAPFVTLNEVRSRKSWTTPALLELIRQRDSENGKSDPLYYYTIIQAHPELKKLRNKLKEK